MAAGVFVVVRDNHRGVSVQFLAKVPDKKREKEKKKRRYHTVQKWGDPFYLTNKSTFTDSTIALSRKPAIFFSERFINGCSTREQGLLDTRARVLFKQKSILCILLCAKVYRTMTSG